MKEKVKTFLFIELITLMVCGLAHVSSILMSESFPLNTYALTMGAVLFLFIFTIFIVEPLYDWFFD